MSAKSFERLAHRIGGRYQRVRRDATALDLVYGDLEDAEYRILRRRVDMDHDIVQVSLIFTPGRDRRRVREEILRDEPLRKVVRDLGVVPFPEGELQVSGLDEASLTVELRRRSFRWKRRHTLEGIERLLRTFVAATTRGALPLWRGCRCCRAATEISIRPEDDHTFAKRLCEPCARLEARTRPESQEHGFSPVDVDPRRYEERCSGLREWMSADPAGYRRMLSRWALLGRAVMMGSSLLLIAAVLAGVGLVALAIFRGWFPGAMGALLPKLAGFLIPLAIAGGALLWKLIASLLPPRPSLEGLRIPRGRVPSFAAWLDGIADSVGAPRADRIYLDADANASVTEVHTGFGRYESVLTLGVPFLELLPEEELATVLGHEFGHLRHRDPAEARVYRTVSGWVELVPLLEARGPALLDRFYRRYVPEFFLRAGIVARQKELDADLRSAGVSSPEVAGRALIRTALLGELMAAALGRALGKLEGDDLMRRDLVGFWRRCLEDVPPDERERAYREELERKASWLDSHPPLLERLANLGLVPPPEPPWDLRPAHSAHERMEDYELWKAEALADTTEHFVAFEERARTRREAAVREILWLHAQEPCAAAQVQLARMARELGEPEQALAGYGKALAEDPDHADARRECVEVLAERERWSEAADALEPLMRPGVDLDPDFLLTATCVLESVGRPSEAAACCERILGFDPPAAIRADIEDRASRLRGGSAGP